MGSITGGEFVHRSNRAVWIERDELNGRKGAMTLREPPTNPTQCGTERDAYYHRVQKASSGKREKPQTKEVSQPFAGEGGEKF